MNSLIYRDINTLFRSQSLASKIIYEQMKFLGHHYLLISLKPVIDMVHFFLLVIFQKKNFMQKLTKREYCSSTPGRNLSFKSEWCWWFTLYFCRAKWFPGRILLTSPVECSCKRRVLFKRDIDRFAAIARNYILRIVFFVTY